MTYLRLLLLVEEYSPPISILYLTLSCAILSDFFHLLLILFISTFIFWRIVFFDLPFIRFHSRFQVRDRLMIQFNDLLNVCHIHFQHLFHAKYSVYFFYKKSHYLVSYFFLWSYLRFIFFFCWIFSCVQ